jgi:hypothetical protein
MTHRFFWYICSKASAISNALISSLSWNFRNSLPPCPVMYTKTFDRSSVRSLLERGTEGSTRPVQKLNDAILIQIERYTHRSTHEWSSRLSPHNHDNRLQCCPRTNQGDVLGWHRHFLETYFSNYKRRHLQAWEWYSSRGCLTAWQCDTWFTPQPNIARVI